jgi:hypothetical protein
LYITFWGINLTLISLGFLFVSSGRQVLERKLVERGEELEEKEKSKFWRK